MPDVTKHFFAELFILLGTTDSHHCCCHLAIFSKQQCLSVAGIDDSPPSLGLSTQCRTPTRVYTVQIPSTMLHAGSFPTGCNGLAMAAMAETVTAAGISTNGTVPFVCVRVFFSLKCRPGKLVRCRGFKKILQSFGNRRMVQSDE